MHPAITPSQTYTPNMLLLNTLVSYIRYCGHCDAGVGGGRIYRNTTDCPALQRIVHFFVIAELFTLLTRRFDAATDWCKQRRTHVRVVLRPSAETNRWQDEMVYITTVNRQRADNNINIREYTIMQYTHYNIYIYIYHVKNAMCVHSEKTKTSTLSSRTFDIIAQQ